MVFYFLTKVVDPPMVIYMGADKYENEELLKWGFPEDVWFHVDDLSSAHVYLRPPPGTTIDDIPLSVLTDCTQLVKANSIEGSKRASVNVVYTPFTNLKKTKSMDVGQVGYHNIKLVKHFFVEKKDNDILKRLNKTKEERHGDLQAEREERDRQERLKQRKLQEEQRRKERAEIEAKKKEEEIKTYKSVMLEDNMKSNQYVDGIDYKSFDDDFM